MHLLALFSEKNPLKKCQKITAVGTSYDISDVNHNSSDTIKYKILLDTQTFP